jgi:uncharacterized protein
MIPARVSVITLGARDLPALRAFYNRLGWEERPGSDDDFTVFRTGGGVLSLYPLENLIEDTAASATVEPGRFKGVTLGVNVESADLVDRAIDRARDVGARIAMEPQNMPWGGRSGYFLDPEDNCWEVAWAPGTSFDERGALIWL